jgi:hypothetical protein
MSLKQDKPWETLGISRATWYRYGKPIEKAVYDDQRFGKRGHAGGGSLDEFANDLKNHFGISSIRSYQRMMRVRMSPLWPYVERGEVSIAKADRNLADPEFMRRLDKLAKAVLAAEVAKALKLFEQERRNDVSAEAIADHLNQPVAVIVEALRLLQD